MSKTKKTDKEWKKQLTVEQYAVTREKATERPFTGKYHDNKKEGLYRCICCGSDLFRSDAKFDSGTGWPSFCKPSREGSVKLEIDRSHGMVRTEVICSGCEAHLGHVFPDGPEPTGMRFCINSCSLDFYEEKIETR